MKLKDYLEELNTLVKIKPEVLDMEVVYSQDDEGNSYQSVNFTPEVISVGNLDNYFMEVANEGGIEVICIN